MENALTRAFFFIFSNGLGGLVMRLNQVLITMPILDKGRDFTFIFSRGFELFPTSAAQTCNG